MNADIREILNQLDTSWMHIRHRGYQMSKEEVGKVMEYGIEKGYKAISEFSDQEVDQVLNLKAAEK